MMFKTGKTKEDIEKEEARASSFARLNELDRLSVRPLRAILSLHSNEVPKEEDIAKLAEYEAEAEKIREEMK